MKLKNKRLLIFDVDGVLINSKKNMESSFKKMCKINNLDKLKFNDYFDKIGLPFKIIMLKLGIKKNHSKLQSDYFNLSLKFKNKISPYKGVYNTLKHLEKNKFKLAIVTSKAKKNSKKFLKYFFPKIEFKLICSPNSKLKPKPNPDMLLYVCKKLNITPSKSLYVGDTFYDYQAARGSKMSFILAKYGYFSKDKKIKTNYKIKKFSDIINLLAND